MTFPPSASLEGASLPDGLAQFSSGASDVPIPTALILIPLLLLASILLGFDPTTSAIDLFIFTCCSLATFLRGTTDTTSRRRSSFHLDTPYPHPVPPCWRRTLPITKPMVVTKGRQLNGETFLTIRGLPSDVSEAELRTFLEPALQAEYGVLETPGSSLDSIRAQPDSNSRHQRLGFCGWCKEEDILCECPL